MIIVAVAIMIVILAGSAISMLPGEFLEMRPGSTTDTDVPIVASQPEDVTVEPQPATKNSDPAIPPPARQTRPTSAPIPIILEPGNRYSAMLIQQRLSDLGYYSSKVDGLWGAGSRSALNGFRRNTGLIESTEWNLITQIVLFEESQQIDDSP